MALTGTRIAVTAAAVVAVAWMVGGYNRMVRLRNALIASFVRVDELLAQRHQQIERQAELLAAALTSAGPRLEALRAACRQAEAARSHARLRPASAEAVTSLRVAEEILADTRARLPMQGVAGGELPELNALLTATDTGLEFARREFGAAVAAYNAAIHQFPTVLLAWLFGFRPGAKL